MSDIYLSHLACEPLKEYLISQGHTLRLVYGDSRYGAGVESHADLRLCVVRREVIKPQTLPLPRYPENAAMCALVLDGFLVHRLDITDPRLLERCRELGLREISVRQGYTKCSCVVVDGRSVITSDRGIFEALSRIPELSVLKISQGHVLLPGFDTGFIGGASGAVGDEVIFNGDLSAHPDLDSISDFIEMRGKRLKHFPEYPLTDIGSIIEAP